MNKCLNCYHWKACYSGKEWDAAIGNPCKYFISAENIVEVIRCKDCIHNSEDNGCLCHLVDEGGIKFFPFDDHFCGSGERKEATP